MCACPWPRSTKSASSETAGTCLSAEVRMMVQYVFAPLHTFAPVSRGPSAHIPSLSYGSLIDACLNPVFRQDVFLHQRVLPRMVLISPEDLPEESGGGMADRLCAAATRPVVRPTNVTTDCLSTGLETGLIIRAGGSKVEVPLIGPNEGELRTVRVWDQVFEGAVDQGDSVANFLSDFLGTPVRLVHQPKVPRRECFCVVHVLLSEL